MRCAECPLTLPCWSGTLGLTQARPELCPQCKRFVVATLPEGDQQAVGVGLWYALKCEQRPWNRKMRRQLTKQQSKRHGPSSSNYMAPPESIEDPANRLSMGLVLGVCVICSGWVARWNGKYIDLDEQLQAEKEDA